MDLTTKKKAGEHVLGAKFLTHRNVNLEAVARTFRPLWRTRGNFEVNDAGNNKVLFDFEFEVDAVKVLMGEPWTFDRHLVVLIGMMVPHQFRTYSLNQPPSGFKYMISPSLICQRRLLSALENHLVL